MRRRHCNTLPATPSTLPPQAAVPGFIKSALVAPRASLTGDAATAQLADDMRQASHREGGITRDDLESMGWSAAQLDAFGSKARARAQRLAGATV